MDEIRRVELCRYFHPRGPKGTWPEFRPHDDEQDRTCPAWFKLREAIRWAARTGQQEFVLREVLPDYAERLQITTLPREIGELKEVRRLVLYGSNLVRIPPEIGQMDSLERFEPYTSYRLHWFPYEITKCQKLRNSTISTRALYGNFKNRPPFPNLRRNPVRYPLDEIPCSVCGRVLEQSRINQVWISLLVATDVLPLLANLCSRTCFELLPEPPDNYIQHPHKGGLGQAQPPRDW
jgi:hypothetical protein